MDAVQRAIEWLEAEKESVQTDFERSDADWRMEYGVKETHDERMAAFDLAIQALRQMKPSDADVDKIIATGEYLCGLNDDNLADLIIQTNEVQNYIVESFTALRQMRSEPCWHCKGIEAHSIKLVKTVMDEFGCELEAYDMPYKFCPNCGRKLEG